MKIVFKYEKLNNLCVKCGLLDHDIKICYIKEDGDPLPYGAWLRVEVGMTFHSSSQRSGVGRECLSTYQQMAVVEQEDVPGCGEDNATKVQSGLVAKDDEL